MYRSSDERIYNMRHTSCDCKSREWKLVYGNVRSILRGVPLDVPDPPISPSRAALL